MIKQVNKRLRYKLFISLSLKKKITLRTFRCTHVDLLGSRKASMIYTYLVNQKSFWLLKRNQKDCHKELRSALFRTNISVLLRLLLKIFNPGAIELEPKYTSYKGSFIFYCEMIESTQGALIFTKAVYATFFELVYVLFVLLN